MTYWAKANVIRTGRIHGKHAAQSSRKYSTRNKEKIAGVIKSPA